MSSNQPVPQRAFVYLLKHATKHWIKIGKAKDLEKRFGQLEDSGNTFDYTASYFVPCESEAAARALETRLHRAFCRQRFSLGFAGGTEWFGSSIMPIAVGLIDGIQRVQQPAPRIPVKKRARRPRPVSPDELYHHWEYELRWLIWLNSGLREVQLVGNWLRLINPYRDTYEEIHKLYHFTIHVPYGDCGGPFRMFSRLLHEEGSQIWWLEFTDPTCCRVIQDLVYVVTNEPPYGSVVEQQSDEVYSKDG